MKTVLSQLDGNEAILLMYLADELPPRDRAEVEQLLARDADMRRQLDELRGAWESVDKVIAADVPLATYRADRCAEETIAAMRNWQAAPPQNRLEVVTEEKKLLLPWWSYPMAAAASIVVAAAVFFANVEPPPMIPAVVPRVATSIPDLLSSQVLGELSPMPIDPFAQYAMAEELAASFDESQRVLSDATLESNLFDARREVSTLQALSQDAFASVDWRW